MRDIEEATQRLKTEQQKRAREVLLDLNARGVKKIGKDKVQQLMREDSELDYESVMQFYMNILKKDRDAFELAKT